MPYTRAELLEAVRQDHPEFRSIDDNKLFAAIAVDHPDLAKGISELHQEPYQSPKYGPTGATAGQVAFDRAADVLRGIPQAITGIPAAIKGTAKAIVDFGSRGPMAVAGDIATGNQGPAASAVNGMVAPVVTPTKQLIELARPGLVNAPGPESPESVAAAQGAGALFGSSILAKFGPEAVQAAKKPVTDFVNRVNTAAGNAVNKVTNRPFFQPTEVKPAVTLDAARVNKWMGVAPKEVEYGSNPGQQLIDDNLLGATKEATKANVKTALADAGKQIQTKLVDAGSKGVTIDAQAPVYDSATQAIKRIGAPKDTTFTNQIDGIVDDIESRYPDLAKLTPEKAHALKVELGDAIDWHGEAFNNPANQVLVRIYRSINDAIKTEVPDIGPIQERWGNLYSASKNLKRGMAKDVVGSGSGAPAPAEIPAETGLSPAVRYGKNALKYAAPFVIGEGAMRLYRGFNQP